MVSENIITSRQVWEKKKKKTQGANTLFPDEEIVPMK